MTRMIKLISITLIAASIIGCADQYEFTNNKKTNELLNYLSEGDFYTCNLINQKKQGEKEKYLSSEPNKNITLILKDKKLGLIYKKDKWNNGNSMYESGKTINEYYPLDVNAKNEKISEVSKSEVIIKFDKSILKTNLLEKDIYRGYNCAKVEKMLSEAAKRQIVKNFLYPSNKARSE